LIHFYKRYCQKKFSMSDEEADVLDPKEELLKNQRKEKKDLQAKIQALKKTASKGDKKKKKRGE